MDYKAHKAIINKVSVFVRITGIVFLIASFWYLYWVYSHFNIESGLSILSSTIFLFATILVVFNGILFVINNWSFQISKPEKLSAGLEPTVGILIPTYNESVDIITKTLKSVVRQNWPQNKRIIVVSDDGRRPELRLAIKAFKLENRESNIIYHLPPRKNSPDRRGDAKAGNLNSALGLILSKFPYISYIETRDADDLVGDKDFLRYCVQSLERDQKISFVQTIKRCLVKDGDPFSNQESIFYERAMPARLAANAVFPCGSGLVWRLSGLKKIGGFPFWNLVEDLQSGYEILQKGGKGEYLPIVGALGQIAPEDIPNFYKQRGIWALDSLRLFFYKNPILMSGLSIRQKIQFFEMGYAYMLSFAIPPFILNLILSLVFGVYPVAGSGIEYVSLLALFAMTFELFNAARAWGISYKSQWRSRQAWLGLMPVFILAFFKALWYGPNTKPTYVVTRKYHKVGWYWKETIVQSSCAILLTISILINISAKQLHDPIADIASIFWASFFLISLLQIIQNSWAGINLREKIALPRFNLKPFAISTVRS
jgi:cellulose synthase (UDP-forming)